MKKIFRQKTYQGEWVIQNDKAYFRPIKVVNIEKARLISDEQIAEYEIVLPLLSKGDEIYLSDKNIVVTIQSVVRSTNNEVIYYIDDNIISPSNEQRN